MRRCPELSTRLMRCALATTAATLCLCGWARAARTANYDDYLKWDEKTKWRYVQRHVRRDKDGYFVVTVSAYQVRTKISPQYALRMAILMDDFYRQFAAIFNAQFKDRGHPQLYVFPDMKTYRGYVASLGVDPGWSTGVYVPGKKILVGQLSHGEKRLKEILFHEGTHQLLHAYTGQCRIPPWFSEGVATNFETWDLKLSAQENVKTSILKANWLPVAANAVRQQRAKSGSSEVDKVPVAADAARKQRYYDLRELLDIDNQAWNAAADPQLNYAMAWSLVNYLLKNTSTRDIQQFNAILTAIYEGRNIQKVLTPLAHKRLEAGWHKDLKTRVLLYDAYIRPALAAKTELLPAAVELISKGITKFPDLPDGRYYRGRLLMKSEKYAQAIKDFMAIEKKGSGFPKFHKLLGTCYFKTGEKGKARRTLFKARRKDRRDEEIKKMLAEIWRSGRR